MSLKHGILGLLSYGSMTGYDVMKLFNESLNFFWNTQTSQIYRELDTLEKKEWVTSEYVVQKDKPNKKIFTLSDDGKRELISWLDEHSVKNAMKIRDEMTMRVFFGSNGDKDILKKELIEYRKINEEFSRRLKQAEGELDYREQLTGKKGEKMYWLMAIKRGHFTAESNIQWVDDCMELLEAEEG
ncbi:PadR family transcriptional regulator [Clostridium ganghwense]|uniref:PadR family transcriptional regulator n=1 Tax=Clostridium ganghwense TaxID=312089 RepID=A0ABT4CK04_9CLOT|nr:PadR family transcriptional regulator [Clostridium ganghwense]MCY6369377.1 PadR family transcriptional regulator [Clostridium ganghwense]